MPKISVFLFVCFFMRVENIFGKEEKKNEKKKIHCASSPLVSLGVLLFIFCLLIYFLHLSPCVLPLVRMTFDLLREIRSVSRRRIFRARKFSVCWYVNFLSVWILSVIVFCFFQFFVVVFCFWKEMFFESVSLEEFIF